MITNKDVYVAFRQSQANFMNRPYRIPTNLDKFISKMSIISQQALTDIAGAFSTRWMNVDPNRFFDCGFELMGKAFSYKKFFDRRVLLFYIEKDKNLKRQQTATKEQFEHSYLFVEQWVEHKPHRTDISVMKQYCMMKEDGVKAPIKHFLDNKIDKFMIVWLISQKFLQLDDDDRRLIPLITENYWQYTNALNKIGEGKIYMGKKLPKDIPYDTQTKSLSGKKMLYDKGLPDGVEEKYKEDITNLNESEDVI